jgi:hypothetical protein
MTYRNNGKGKDLALLFAPRKAQRRVEIIKNRMDSSTLLSGEEQCNDWKGKADSSPKNGSE